MTTVAEYFGKRQPRLTAEHPSIVMQCGVGIELEMEGVSHIEAGLWNCTEDGSLRDGCELVCAQPYNGQQLFRAIHNLSEAVKDSGAEGTWRCSTHVHVDVRDCNANIVKKIILGWAFYEKLMFKCSGFHRYRSNFCPAFAVVQAQVMNASSAFNYDGPEFFNRIVNTWDKYTSLNLLPLSQYGSVEFRISEPKWKRSQLLNLVNRFLMLKKLAVDNAEMNNEEYIEHLNTVRFAPMLDHLPLDYVPCEEDLDEGYRLARDILFCRSNDVTQVGRIRVATPRDPNEVLSLTNIPSFYEYFGYIRRNARSVYNTIVETYGEQYSTARAATEPEFNAMMAILRDSGHGDDNVTDYIPRRLTEEFDAVYG